MNAQGRRSKLLDWLEKEETLGLVEMAQYFGVSKMTIHPGFELPGKAKIAETHPWRCCQSCPQE